MKSSREDTNDIPISIVGSNKFGRFPKISVEETFNMIIVDGWLAPFGGYERVKNLFGANKSIEGRGIYASSKLEKLFIAVHNFIYVFDKNLSYSLVGKMETYNGDVFIDENLTDQVVFSDQKNLYVYNNSTFTFTTLTPATLGFVPGYITFQDSRIISPSLGTHFWQISEVGDATLWPGGAQFVGALETKSTNCVGCIRFPGLGNMLLVFGNTVAEIFTDTPQALFPYQRNQSKNLDYGCINAASIASNEDKVCWVGINEQSGPAIMFTKGFEPEKISTDGMDSRLSQLKNPQNCYGFMVRLAGHELYVVTFVTDNVTYAYDFNTNSFFTLCDEKMNAFIVRRIAFFNNNYYFVSLIDGNLYRLSENLFTYDYGDGDIHQIPMIRVLPNIRHADQRRRSYPYVTFTIEQGASKYTQPIGNNTQPRIDLTISRDGGVTFGNAVSKPLYVQGNRKNLLIWRSLGSANDLVLQFRFHIFGRVLATDGIIGEHE